MAKTTTLYGITGDDMNNLQRLAKKFGFVSQRGPAMGEGSASKLIKAIASEKVLLVKIGSDGKDTTQ